MVLVGLTSCTSFDDPTTENYGAGPSVDVTITAGTPSDSAFTVVIRRQPVLFIMLMPSARAKLLRLSTLQPFIRVAMATVLSRLPTRQRRLSTLLMQTPILPTTSMLLPVATRVSSVI